MHGSVAVELRVTGASPVLVEGCASCDLVLDGDNVVVGLDGLALPFALPRGFVLDGRELPEGRVVVVLSARDSFKAEEDVSRLVFCDQPLDAWLAERGLSRADVFSPRDPPDLFAARLFCLGPTPALLRGYLERPDAAWTAAFRAARRLSLAAIQDRDDPARREERRLALRRELLRERFRAGRGWRDVSAADFASAFAPAEWTQPLAAWLDRTDDPLLRAYRERSFRALAPGGRSASRSPEIDYVSHAAGERPLRSALKEDQIVWARAPVRLDLAGGWTDTPPYTLRYGGRVVNVAVDLNGQPPIQVFCRRTAERHVRVHSIDLGHTETFTRLRRSSSTTATRCRPSRCRRPPCACSAWTRPAREAVRSTTSSTVSAAASRSPCCAPFPKGSGLGTSSILGGVILAALSRFFGRTVVPDELIRQVLQVEQMLTTGGGWQDQIGGLVPGVKCVESRPGLRPHPVVHQLDPFLFQDRESLARFTLFYTGITRLAKSILADVVDRVNAADKAYLFTLRHMAQLALDAKDAIERRDGDALGEVIALSWAANRRMHAQHDATRRWRSCWPPRRRTSPA